MKIEVKFMYIVLYVNHIFKGFHSIVNKMYMEWESRHKSEINSKIKETIYLLNPINLLNNIIYNKTILKFISL